MPQLPHTLSSLHSRKSDVRRAGPDKFHSAGRREHEGLDLIYRVQIKFEIIETDKNLHSWSIPGLPEPGGEIIEVERTSFRRRKRRVLLGSGELRADEIRKALQIALALPDRNPCRRSIGFAMICPLLSHSDSFPIAAGRAKEIPARRIIDVED